MQDINRIIEFYNSNNPKNKISRIYIIGMVSKLKDAEEYFYKKLNVKTKIVKLLQRIDFNKKSIQLKPRQLNFINCLGAANLQDRRFVFLKDDLKIQKRPFVTTAKFHKLMICLIVVIIGYIVTIKLSTDELKGKVDIYNEFINSKSSLVSLQNQINSKKTELQNQTALVEGIGYGAEKAVDAIKTLETAIEEVAAGSIIRVRSYKYNATSKTLDVKGDLTLPVGVDGNSMESLKYKNLPHDIKDKIVEKGYEVEITPSDETFLLKISI